MPLLWKVCGNCGAVISSTARVAGDAVQSGEMLRLWGATRRR